MVWNPAGPNRAPRGRPLVPHSPNMVADCTSPGGCATSPGAKYGWDAMK